MARGGPGLVAGGYSYTTPAADAAIWISTDGLAWEIIPHDNAVFGGAGNQLIAGVTPGGPGVVAVGFDEQFDLEAIEESRNKNAAVWYSSDGRSWARVPHDDAVFGGEGDQAMNSVAAGGPGLVAVGYDGREPSDAAVWVSADGISWTRVPHDERFLVGEDAVMSSVIASGSGMVAVGSDGPQFHRRAAVWTSPDGVRWTRVYLDVVVFEGDGGQSMTEVTLGPAGLVAVGAEGIDGDSDAAVWTSSDTGKHWLRVRHDEGFFGGEGDQVMFDVTLAGQELVAVGYDLIDKSEETDHKEDAAVWTSLDGVQRSRVDDRSDVFAASKYQLMYAVVSDGETVIAAGTDRSGESASAAVWCATRQS